jgi:two-component system cell cycle sensor histidine kinase/response regulator CckA
VRTVVQDLLRARGYRVLAADDGPAGVALYRQHRGEIRAVVTDMMMPTMQGAEVVRELRMLNPDIRIVEMSGMMDNSGDAEEETDRLAFVQKPMTSRALIGAVQRVLGAPALR